MAHAVSYETYSENPNFTDSMTNRQPVKGSIPLYQGMIGVANNFKPFPYSSAVSGFDSAGLYLHNPLPASPEVLAEGGRLFSIYCSPCHGMSGKSDGSIVVNANIQHPFPPPPTYFLPDNLKLTEGNMFHIVHYGRNLMGSYATQLDQKQVWMVIHYVRSLQQHYMDSVKVSGGKTVALKESTKK
jgi:mono/diheme cytochrome c family protein